MTARKKTTDDSSKEKADLIDLKDPFSDLEKLKVFRCRSRTSPTLIVAVMAFP